MAVGSRRRLRLSPPVAVRIRRRLGSLAVALGSGSRQRFGSGPGGCM